MSMAQPNACQICGEKWFNRCSCDDKKFSKFNVEVDKDSGVISIQETIQKKIINYQLNTKDEMVRASLIKLGWTPPGERPIENFPKYAIYYDGQVRDVADIKEWLTDEAVDNGWYAAQTVEDMRDCIDGLMKQLELERHIRMSQYEE